MVIDTICRALSIVLVMSVAVEAEAGDRASNDRALSANGVRATVQVVQDVTPQSVTPQKPSEPKILNATADATVAGSEPSTLVVPAASNPPETTPPLANDVTKDVPKDIAKLADKDADKDKAAAVPTASVQCIAGCYANAKSGKSAN